MHIKTTRSLPYLKPKAKFTFNFTTNLINYLFNPFPEFGMGCQVPMPT